MLVERLLRLGAGDGGGSSSGSGGGASGGAGGGTAEGVGQSGGSVASHVGVGTEEGGMSLLERILQMMGEAMGPGSSRAGGAGAEIGRS